MERLTCKYDNENVLRECCTFDRESNIEPNDVLSCDIICNRGCSTCPIQRAFDKLAYYEDLEEQGRLIVLSVKDIHPCRNCDTGWGSLSSDGTSESCHDTCERLKEYNEKYNK